MSRKFEALFLLSFAVFLTGSVDAAVVEGKVTNAAGSVRLAGKVVAGYDTTGVLRGVASTDGAGMYTLSLPNGGYRLLAYDPDGEYATSFSGDAESFETTPVLQVGEGAPLQVNFALTAGGRVAGVVTGGSRELAGAVVEAYNPSGTRRGFTTTNGDGEYSLVLPAGDFKLFAYDSTGFYAGEFHANVRAFADGAPVHVTPPATTPVSFHLERAARASGVVLDADTRAALPSMFVYAYTAAGARVKGTTTDANGAFTFSLGPGQYRFVAGDPAQMYGPAFFPGGRSFAGSGIVTLAAGQELDGVTIVAERGALIRGHVPPGLEVAAYNLDGTEHASTHADATGAYVLVVAPGDYKLAVFDRAGAYAPQFHAHASDFGSADAIAILAGQTLGGIDFDPPRAGRFVGTVRDASNNLPLVAKMVSVYDAAGARIAQTATVQNGTYAVAVAPGQYRLLVYDDTLQYATAYAGGAASYDATVPQSVAAGEQTTADFTMRRGVRLGGTVRDTSGAAIEGVEIFALDPAGNRVTGATSHAGSFTMVLLPGVYRFLAVDPRHRYRAEAYADGATLTIGLQTPSPIAFILDSVHRRRTVRR